jgi:xanthosine utilization system XapX-like protein
MKGQKQLVGSLLGGGILGLIFGALVGLESNSPGVWALMGGVGFGLGELITTMVRKQGENKPVLYRILASSFLGAGLSAGLGQLFPGITWITAGILVGFVAGIIGLNMQKIVLGIVLGILVGLLMDYGIVPASFALAGGGTIFLFRSISAIFYQHAQPLQLSAEQVPKEQVRFVVPFESNSNYIGADYFKNLAREEGGAFKRNAEGIGIVESLEILRGPHFDPDRVTPLIREFYEHTSRFKLNIVPEWDWRYKWLFSIFKQTIAQPMGQANLPFNQEEAQKGMVSYIDTIDFSCNDIVDLRAWVRAFEATGEAIYVGVYTTFRWDDVGYVSVGFPLPNANFTATLLPFNLGDGNLILRSRNTGLAYPGHYLSTSEGGDNLTVLKLPTFNEEIEVFVKDGELCTEHRFYMGRLNFLKLHYSMTRIQGQG